MKDFTLSSFELLLTTLLNRGYAFSTFENFLVQKPTGKLVILRHDVDDKPKNSFKTAIIESRLGIKGTYYFRIVKKSNDPEVIRSIVRLGHEIGYHYEDLAIANGNPEKAIQLFKKNLEYFRKFYPVKTICMHGSPLSKWNNCKLWDFYDYKKHELLGEPYLEIDFNKFCYLTDTGRKWDSKKVNIRDKVISSNKLRFRTTFDIIKGVDKLPQQLMITTHPQRWNDSFLPWMEEFVFQNCKNIVKRVIATK